MSVPDSNTQPWRCVIKVRSNHMTRIFSSVTHPTELGASAMQLPLKSTRARVPAAFLLLLDILKEEAAADVRVPGVVPVECIDRPVKPKTQRISHTNLQAVNEDDFIPPPPPPVVCEFDLGVSERKNSRGRYLSVIFWMMIFSLEGIVRIQPRRSNHEQGSGSDPETSGVWRASPRRQRPPKDTARDIRPARRGAAG